MTTFALIHGAWHGAWCWEKVTPLLQAAGHGVVAPELPSDDPKATTFDSYADVVCAALADLDDDVVVVGHSLGGPTATLVAARRSVRHLVYLCGMIPDPGCSLFDQFQSRPDLASSDWSSGLSDPDEHLRATWMDFEMARSLFYADCDELCAVDAFTRLRPQSFHPFTTPCPLSELPAVPYTYVVCSEDRMLNPEWSRQVAGGLGADIVELPGGHSPLLSRPSAVAEVLLRAATSGFGHDPSE